jgi:pterin-4a-carbinolamine dehydratase
MNTQEQQFAALAAEGVRKMRRPPRPTEALKPERIQEELKKLRGWRLAPDGQAILFSREFSQPWAAAKFASFVAELAMADRQPVHLGITGSRVLLTLPRRANTAGLTMPVFAFARQLG